MTAPSDAGSSRPLLRLLVVEDDRRIRRFLARILEASPALQVLDTVVSGQLALKRCADLQPDVVLLDLGLPDMDGVEVTRRIKEQWPSIEILVYTVFEDEDRVLEAIRAGAGGYLLKGARAERLVEAIQDVAAGGSVVQPRLARALLRHFQQPRPPTKQQGLQVRLTDRELEILRLIAKGLSNRQVAELLGLSRSTVRTHLEHIYQKLDVSNRTEAVALGISQGLIDA